jgi:acetyl-CoA acetyltransferase
MHETATREEDLAELAVLMRRHAGLHPDAHLTAPLTVADVMASRPISRPLKLLDCCPISDGAAAFVVSSQSDEGPTVRIAGCGQAHRHQHLSALEDILSCGAGEASRAAFDQAAMSIEEIDYLAIYDSFTITLAMLLEEIGFASRGEAGLRARRGDFSRTGPLPLNLHGGLLSFGHSGVAGGMAHIVEAVRQLRGEAAERQANGVRRAFVHADGGVMSAHVSLVLERTQ